MSNYIRSFIGPEEHITLLARPHWIYLMEGVVWMMALLVFGGAFDYLLREYAESSLPLAGSEIPGLHINSGTPLMLFLFGVCGLFIFLVYIAKMLATEIAVTTHRLIYKTGFIFVEVEETDLVEIRAEHIHHGLLGRFLGYGTLRLDSRFVGDITLPAIKKPYKIIKAMHAARGKMPDPMADAPVHAPVHYHTTH